jgi:NADP-dependent 3-hydroxy acid dehydrogenase YdfG
MLEPSERVIMVSGAGGGIGGAMAKCLYDKGYSISLGARTIQKLGSWVADGDPSRILTHAYEATDPANNAKWVDATVAKFGRIDGLINSAGMGGMVNLEDDDDETYDALWAVNVKAPMRMIRLTLPHLRKCGSGRIINISSLSGKRVTNDGTGYALSKFALMAVTHATRRAGWDEGVRATAVCPSWVNTDMAARAEGITKEDMIQPEDLAEMVSTVIALPNSAVVAELLVNCSLGDLF